MSSTANVQSFLPYVFRPAYTYSSSNGFKTLFNIRNIDTVTASTLNVGQLQIGDTNSNVFIGNSITGSASVLANSNTNSTIIGVNAGLGVSNSTSFESYGYSSGQNARYVSNSSFIGTNAGYASSNISNSFFGGYSAGYGAIGLSNSLFIGQGAGSNSSNANGVIAIGSGAYSWATQTASGSSNIFIGNSSAPGFTGSGNIVIGHGITPSTMPTYNWYYGESTLHTVPSDMSNKLFIGSPGATSTSPANILLAGDFSNGYLSIGSTNTIPVSCNTGSYSLVGTGLQLDVAKYVRIGQGLSIGTDPGNYQLDVNGPMHVYDGYGGDLAFTPPVVGSSNSALTLKPITGGTMTMNVVGTVSTTNGIYSLKSASYSSGVTLSGILSYGSVSSASSTGTASGSITTYLGTFSPVPAPGTTILVTGFQTVGYNGVFSVVTSSSTTVTVVNSGVAATTASGSGTMNNNSSGYVISNALPIRKNDSGVVVPWCGLIIGTMMSTTSPDQYYSTTTTIKADGSFVNQTSPAARISIMFIWSNIVIYNTYTTDISNVLYNFTLYPAF